MTLRHLYMQPALTSAEVSDKAQLATSLVQTMATSSNVFFSCDQFIAMRDSNDKVSCAFLIFPDVTTDSVPLILCHVRCSCSHRPGTADNVYKPNYFRSAIYNFGTSKYHSLFDVIGKHHSQQTNKIAALNS